jgi:hypothetical protein
LTAAPIVATGAVNGRDDAAPGAPLAVTGVIGQVTDQSGAPIPGAQMTLRNEATGATRHAVSDAGGWYYFAGLAAGQYQLTSQLTGFGPRQRRVRYTGGRYVANFTLSVGALTEEVTVVAEAPDVLPDEGKRKQREAEVQQAPSANVFALQRRVAGVLPVRVDVPHAGESFRFVRALVLDEETQLRFKYKARGKR